MQATTAAGRAADRRCELDFLQNNGEFYARNFLTIVNKDGVRVDFNYNGAQHALEELRQEQRDNGKAARLIALKARQVGVSTVGQGWEIQRTTTRPNHQGLVVAHDVSTGNKLFAMGQGMYANLDPEFVYEDSEGVERPLKPEIRAQKRGRQLVFGQAERDAWMLGKLWPNSEYLVDTAKEFQAGRGATYHSLHASELAFWDDIFTKLTALKNAVPKTVDSLVLIESTANGHNGFKEQWDLAESGESEYAPFFWPWWKEDSYEIGFTSQAEFERFQIGDTEQSRYAAEEPELVLILERAGFDRDRIKRKLNWRRHTIINECSGRLDLFHQEYPSFPEEAFLGTGSRVFDPHMVKALTTHIESKVRTPIIGELVAGNMRSEEGRTGPVEVPEKPRFRPAEDAEAGTVAPWKFWLEHGEGGLIVPNRRYVIGVDVSGGETEGEGSEPAFHAIEVIDHLTGEQMAEYTSRVDPAMLTPQVLLACLLFNEAWVLVERTGYWGMPTLRTLWFDYHYPYVYREKRHGATQEKTEHRLGWNTSPKTKPLLLSLGQELLATESSGIKSRLLAGEMFTYVRKEDGKTVPEPGKFSDRLMGWLIAQQGRSEIPPEVLEDSDEPGSDTEASGVISTHRVRDARTGY